MVLEIWQYIRTGNGADILPTKCLCTSLEKNIIIITITFVVVVVTVFSESETRLSRLEYG